MDDPQWGQVVVLCAVPVGLCIGLLLGVFIGWMSDR